VLFAILTIASGMLTLKIPAINSTFSVSEAFAFASVLLFGPAVGAVTLALDGVRISARWRMGLTNTLFNFANLGLSIWAAGHAFFALSGVQPLYAGPAPSASVIPYAALMVAVYFTTNTVLTATVAALSERRSIVTAWRVHYLPLLPGYVAGAAVALLLVLAFREVQFTAVALILPLLLICYLTFQSSFGRLEDAKQHVDKLNRLLMSTVETLATAIDAKDEATHDHVRRVQQGTMALARELGVADPTALQALEAAALLHDTGKIAVPEHILNKPGRLTPAEFEKMKRHAPIGAEILSSIAFPYPVAPIVRHHHENWDGTGYPDGLKGEEIPLGARILQVIDCFDALTSDRPYRRRMTDAQAIAILRERRGVMYDPLVVDAFLSNHARIMPAYDPTPHPASRAIGDARALNREERAQDIPLVVDLGMAEGLLAVTSLSRALTGAARVADIGALLWNILRQVLPCDAMAIFETDPETDGVVARFAAGPQAPRLREIACATGAGVVGWVAVTKRPAVNADPGFDFGHAAREAPPVLRSCLAIPIAASSEYAGVLALYRAEANAFTDDHVRLLELLAARLAEPLALALAADDEDVRAQPMAPLSLIRRANRV
jgi:putative nucleotidyltransferase with HDIG domain